MSSYEDRPYQTDLITETRNAIIAGHRKIVPSSCTGSGKSIVILRIVEMALAKGSKVTIIADRIILIEQLHKHFLAAGIKHGIIQGDNPFFNPAESIQIASIHSIEAKGWPDADMFIVDEAEMKRRSLLEKMEAKDRFCTKTKQFKHRIFIGLTATPKGMAEHWDTLITGLTTREAIDQKVLVDYDLVTGSEQLSRSGLGGKDEFNGKKVEERVAKDRIIADVVHSYVNHGQGLPGIVFANSVPHSKKIVQAFNEAGIHAVHLDSYTPKEEREQIFKLYRQGNIKILSSRYLLSVGFDETIATVAIIATMIKALRLWIQMCGRVLRQHKDKEKAIIIDLGLNYFDHGFPCEFTPEQIWNYKNKSNDTLEKEAREREIKGQEAPKPTKCRGKLPNNKVCGFSKPPGVHKCPQCGFEPERQSTTQHGNEKLAVVDKKSAKEKAEWYAMLLGYAVNKGFKRGWADHKFKEKFESWPHKKNGVVPVKPNNEVMNYIKYLNIKQAKSHNNKNQMRAAS